jgi:hypothetical protein
MIVAKLSRLGVRSTCPVIGSSVQKALSKRMASEPK